MSIFAGKYILIVEDEPIVAMCLEDVIEALGCRVVGPAARLDQAIALARREPIDAAILDVNLGDDRSYPVADLLRARAIPFVFATGYASAGYERMPDAQFIEKPYTAAQIRTALGDMIGG
jgi:CheY-like chemotaxis protein